MGQLWVGLEGLLRVENINSQEAPERRHPGRVASETPLALISCYQDWMSEEVRGGSFPSWYAVLI